MRKLNKTFIYLGLIFFLSTFSVISKAQNYIISYAYDNAGNRISRRVVNLTEEPNPGHVKRDTTAVEEQMGERKITIYPNPTKGVLVLSITGGNDKPLEAGGEEMRIVLYSSTGAVLQNKRVEPELNTLDLSSYPAAYYILRVTAGEMIKEFKIIKQ